MEQPLVTIVIPNFRTEILTKLCFRLLRRHTDCRMVRVIAVDNASGDASVEYLRALPWITLLERSVPPDEDGPTMHAKALDLALEKSTTPFFLVMHTDTLILRPHWLDYLLGEIQSSDRIAGVGCWKLEVSSFRKHFGKKCENLLRFCCGKRQREERYLRSDCALYRTDLLREKSSGFYDGSVAGKRLHRELEQQGYEMKFLPPEELGKYIRHIDHATGIINPVSGSRLKANQKARKRLDDVFRDTFFQEILNTPDLDH